MIKRSLLSVMSLTSLFCSQTALADQAGYEPCEMTDEADVYWAAIDDIVTLKFEMTGDGEYYPTGKVIVTLSDGSELLSVSVSKFVEEGDLSCSAELKAVKSQFINSFSGENKSFLYERELSTLTEAAALFTDEEFCAQTINPYTHEWLAETEKTETRMSKIEKSDIWQTEYLTCNPILEEISFEEGQPSGINIETFQRLLAQDAPFLDIPYAYGSETYLYDHKNQSLIPFYASGC